MVRDISRRRFIQTVSAAAAAGAAAHVAAGAAPADKPAAGKVRIVGISCSPRKGKTTAAGLQACLGAAAKVSADIETELIELAGMNIPIFDPGAKDGQGDFAKIAPKLSDPSVGGIIVGSPVYFGMMSSLCKAFLDQWMAFRKTFALSGKVAGALAVGGMRNGGQELTVQAIQQAMMCQEMVVVGDGRPTAHRGATLWNQKDDVSKDDLGLGTAANLGRRVAEVALRLASGAK